MCGELVAGSWVTGRSIIALNVACALFSDCLKASAFYVEHSHYLRIYMGQLRHKIETDPARPRYLLTEAGIGYRLLEEEST